MQTCHSLSTLHVIKLQRQLTRWTPLSHTHTAHSSALHIRGLSTTNRTTTRRLLICASVGRHPQSVASTLYLPMHLPGISAIHRPSRSIPSLWRCITATMGRPEKSTSASYASRQNGAMPLKHHRCCACTHPTSSACPSGRQTLGSVCPSWGRTWAETARPRSGG